MIHREPSGPEARTDRRRSTAMSRTGSRVPSSSRRSDAKAPARGADDNLGPAIPIIVKAPLRPPRGLRRNAGRLVAAAPIIDVVSPDPAAGRDDDEPQDRIDLEFALWRSAKMREVREIIAQTASADVTVLITGETGTGKGLIARAVHHLGGRRDGPFVKVNCAAVARELLESEMFGHERGAFTGAHQLKIGKFEAADQGTIFLDEIGDLHPALQGKLLHVLEDGQFSRVGGRSNIKVDVRVLAATNQNLEQAVAEGRFREDLYYRLNVVRIVVPPLRERAEEIRPLINYFIDRYAKIFRRDGFTLP